MSLFCLKEKKDFIHALLVKLLKEEKDYKNSYPLLFCIKSNIIYLSIPQAS